jgi:nicotinamide mononucleotide transporter
MDGLTNLKKSFASLKWYEWLMGAIMIAIAGHAMIDAFVNPQADGNPPWLTVANFISAICGIVCIFFCAKASVSNFVFGIVNTIVYAIYLWYWHIWGTFCLEVLLYLPFNIMAWVIWARHRDEVQKEITKARKLSPTQDAIVGGVVILSTIVYHAILVRLGGEVAWLDAATVAIGIIATYLEVMRFREQYVLWLVTDVVAVAMYIQHFDPVYLTKKSIYLIMAVIGLMNWFRLQKRNEANE